MIKTIKRQKWIWLDRLVLRKKIKRSSQPLKIVVGAGNTDYEGWMKTDYPVFDLFQRWQWQFLFRKSSISNVLAEHVFEHFTPNQVENVLKIAYDYMKVGGNFRIAVPDKNHPKMDYLDYVKPGGSGLGADDHKSFWNYEDFQNLAEEIGFEISLLEYYNRNGEIKTTDFDENAGLVIRSYSKGYNHKIPGYSSLILDLIKV